MRVRTARTPRALTQARQRAWQETGWTALGIGITIVAVAVAARGIDAVPSALLWLLAGGSLTDTLSAGSRAWRLWAQWRRSVRCPFCRAAQVQAADGQDRQRVCARTGHQAVKAS